MKYILVTGITGQLGTALAERLSEKGIPAACFVRKPEDRNRLDLKNFKVLSADITNRDSVFRYRGELSGEVDTVVHMASLGDGAPRQRLFKAILKGTSDLYDFANEIKCPKFIYFSSILAAGWIPPGRRCIDEDFAPSPRRLCYYGKMKLAAEEKLLGSSKNNLTKTVILRPGNIYGRPKLSFVKFVVDLLKRRKKVFYQRAKNSVMWAPVHTQDVIDCIFMFLEKETFYNQAYFLTGEEPASLKDLAQIVSGLIDFPVSEMDRLNPREKGELAVRGTIDALRNILGRPSFPNFIYSNEKIKRDIGFSPRIKLKEGIAETIEWANGEGLLQ
jgi:nucleoside-diphosphate-sugar epimerase